MSSHLRVSAAPREIQRWGGGAAPVLPYCRPESFGQIAWSEPSDGSGPSAT